MNPAVPAGPSGATNRQRIDVGSNVLVSIEQALNRPDIHSLITSDLMRESDEALHRRLDQLEPILLLINQAHQAGQELPAPIKDLVAGVASSFVSGVEANTFRQALRNAPEVTLFTSGNIIQDALTLRDNVFNYGLPDVYGHMRGNQASTLRFLYECGATNFRKELFSFLRPWLDKRVLPRDADLSDAAHLIVRYGVMPGWKGSTSDHGAIVQRLRNLIEQIQPHCVEPVEHWPDFFISELRADQPNISLISNLIECGAPVDAHDSRGRFALHIATTFNKVQWLRPLLEAGALVDAMDFTGSSPLHMAARQGFTECVEELLLHGASVNLVNHWQCTPLDYATQEGHGPMALTMLDLLPNFDAFADGGAQLLVTAITGGLKEVASKLIVKGCKIDSVYKDNKTLLHIAAMIGDLSVVKALFDRIPNALGFVDRHGMTALEHAIRHRREDIALFLVEKKSPLGISEPPGHTVLTLAIERGLVQLAKKLVTLGLPLTQRDSWGKTPQQLAQEQGHLSIVTQIVDQLNRRAPPTK